MNSEKPRIVRRGYRANMVSGDGEEPDRLPLPDGDRLARLVQVRTGLLLDPALDTGPC